MVFGTEVFEFRILEVLHEWLSCDFMDAVMVGVSSLGNGGAIWIVAAIIMMSIRKYRKCGYVFVAALLIGLVFGVLIMKNLVARPRPCELFEGFEMLVSKPLDNSFPSGHTLASFISAFILLEVNKKIGLAATVVAVLMAVSRMYLFVHFPTDIMGGIVLALVIYLFVRKYLQMDETAESNE